MQFEDSSLFESVETLLFLCYGNICRSPFCEVYWQNLGTPIKVRSAGFIRNNGRQTPPAFQKMALEHNVELRDHASNFVSDDLIEWADLIIVMDEHNRQDLKAHYPEHVELSVGLGTFLSPPRENIEDPYYLSPAQGKVVYQQMAEGVEALRKTLIPECEKSGADL